MKNTLKKAMSLLLAITLAFSLVSCFEDETGEEIDAQNKDEISRNIEKSKTSEGRLDIFENINDSEETKNVEIEKVKTISSGGLCSGAIKSDGSLYAWGSMYYSKNYGKEPKIIMNDVAQVNFDIFYSAVIKNDGTLWMWGKDYYEGLLGNGTNEPIKVMDDVADVSLGGTYGAVIKNDGSLWMWGNNSSGQLGDGTTIGSNVPIKIMDDVVQVCLCYGHSAAIKKDGTLWMWGYNDYGQLGDGTTEERYEPIKIMEDVAMVSIGSFHSAAIKTDGSLWMWGSNRSGQLGNRTTEDSTVPIKIMDNAVQVSIGLSCSAVIKSDSSLWTWGSNANDVLGDGTTEEKSKKRLDPMKIMDDVILLDLHGTNGMAVKSDGSLWMWGFNDCGQLGNGTTENSAVPIKIMNDVMLPQN